MKTVLVLACLAASTTAADPRWVEPFERSDGVTTHRLVETKVSAVVSIGGPFAPMNVICVRNDVKDRDGYAPLSCLDEHVHGGADKPYAYQHFWLAEPAEDAGYREWVAYVQLLELANEALDNQSLVTVHVDADGYAPNHGGARRCRVAKLVVTSRGRTE